MNAPHSFCAAALCALLAAPALAATVPAVALTAGTTTSAIMSLSDGLLSDTNVFVFSGTAGTAIDIDINRLAAPTDLYAVLRFGDIRGVDVGTATFGAIDTGDEAFGTAYINSQDDTEDDAYGGPYGDPRFTFTLTQTGTYSLFVTALSFWSAGGAVGSPFEITATGIEAAPGVSAVPLPAGGALLLGAFGTLALRRRR